MSDGVEEGEVAVRPAASRDVPVSAGVWRIRGGVLSTEAPLILGVLNVTPDSFSDGGRYLDPDDAERRARELVDAGADLLDVGGESTRPGARPVSAREEWERIAPVLERVTDLPVPVSVDTRKEEVARRALEAGAAVINDVSGLRDDPGIGALAAEYGAGLVVMHMRGDPRTMQDDTQYEDVVDEVKERLRDSLRRAREAGCDPEQVVVDPGIGFGKSVEGNLRLLARVGAFAELGRPVLIGPSRKSFVGHVLDLPVDQRAEGSVAACVVALERGARLFRAHDVRATRRALDLATAVRRAGDRAGVGEADSR